MIGHIKSGQYQKNIARAILKKYCPPCHKARGIHDFILATKSSVWIIITIIEVFANYCIIDKQAISTTFTLLDFYRHQDK